MQWSENSKCEIASGSVGGYSLVVFSQPPPTNCLIPFGYPISLFLSLSFTRSIMDIRARWFVGFVPDVSELTFTASSAALFPGGSILHISFHPFLLLGTTYSDRKAGNEKTAGKERECENPRKYRAKEYVPPTHKNMCGWLYIGGNESQIINQWWDDDDDKERDPPNRHIYFQSWETISIQEESCRGSIYNNKALVAVAAAGLSTVSPTLYSFYWSFCSLTRFLLDDKKPTPSISKTISMDLIATGIIESDQTNTHTFP